MTDDDLDADIARMIATHRARKTLGFQYYETQGTRNRQSQPIIPPGMNAAIRMTWEQHCETYKPGKYGRAVAQQDLERDADLLECVLTAALARATQIGRRNGTVRYGKVIRSVVHGSPRRISGNPQARVGKVVA